MISHHEFGTGKLPLMVTWIAMYIDSNTHNALLCIVGILIHTEYENIAIKVNWKHTREDGMARKGCEISQLLNALSRSLFFSLMNWNWITRVFFLMHRVFDVICYGRWTVFLNIWNALVLTVELVCESKIYIQHNII